MSRDRPPSAPRDRPETLLSRARQELEQALARSHAILESAVDGIVTIDQSGTIESVNPSTEVMFGYSAKELVGRNVKILMPSPYAEEHDGYLRRYLDTGQRKIIGIGREVLGRRKGGATFPLELAVSEFYHGERRYFVGTLRDVTERHRLEEQFRQAQKMEAIGRLAGGVAHDFNTLLGTITGYSEMLRDGLRPGDPLRRAADQIHRAAERGAALTRQLLAFSRRQVLQPGVTDLNAVVAGIEEMLRRLTGDDVELRVRLAPALGRVRIDAGQFEQVLMNLVVNACDAMPRGGRITIETANADRRAVAEDLGGATGDYVVLRVTDTGSGMDEETRSRLFEPFFTTKEVGEGTGLGLSMVYGIVTQSGGRIAVRSRPGAGTAVRIYLPRLAADPDAADAADAAEGGDAEGGHETVLLVEDDEMFRELLAEVLAARGYRLLTAADPAAALAACDRHPGPIDVLVSDVVMPGITGEKLSRILAERYPDLRVVLMSGYPDEDLARRRAAHGDGVPLLQKPFATRELLRTVRRVLDRPPGAPPADAEPAS